MDFEKSYDVVVAGAGMAGVAAALECARAGMRTALVEKTVLIGGLATTGLVDMYLPLCDGRGHQAIHGISEELLHLSLRYGPGKVPPNWREGKGRYMAAFSPASFVLALDEVLLEAGVSVWLDTLICTPKMQDQTVTGVEVENKSGRGLLKAQAVIDTTGDADVAYRAGAPCEEGDNWLSYWALQTSLDHAYRVVDSTVDVGLLEDIRVGGDASGRHHPEDSPKYYGTNGESVSEFVLEGRRLLREHYQRKQQAIGEKGRHDIFPLTLSSMAQFRTTRRIAGRETLDTGQDGQHFETSIGLSPDWRKPGPVWEVPYGTLVPQKIGGLLVAGRCMSSAGDSWEVMRVIPTAAMTGQAAGVAATLAVQRGISPHEVPVEDIQQVLRSKGIPLHIPEIM